MGSGAGLSPANSTLFHALQSGLGLGLSVQKSSTAGSQVPASAPAFVPAQHRQQQQQADAKLRARVFELLSDDAKAVVATGISAGQHPGLALARLALDPQVRLLVEQLQQLEGFGAGNRATAFLSAIDAMPFAQREQGALRLKAEFFPQVGVLRGAAEW
jgi:hypothetical protein